jgi:hypothetical protein
MQCLKKFACALVVVAAVLVIAAPATEARSRGGGFSGHHHGNFHHGFRGRIFIGVGPFIAAPLFWPAYAYPAYPYWDTYEYAPPVYQAPPAQLWYYCPSARGYYPTVPSCPEPWVPVPPR